MHYDFWFNVQNLVYGHSCYYWFLSQLAFVEIDITKDK